MSFQNVIQVRDLTPDQFGELIESRSYQGMKRALSEHAPAKSDESALPEYLTRKETGKFLKVSNTTLHEWAKDTADRPAILVPLKINGRVRYRRSDILAALKEKRQFKAA